MSAGSLWPQLVTGLFTLGAVFLTPWFNHYLDGRKQSRILDLERAKAEWNKRLDTFLALEADAGRLAEVLESWRGREEKAREGYSLLSDLQSREGRFRRYPAVNQALRDLCHSAGIYLYDMDHGGSPTREDSEEQKRQLGAAYRALLASIDEAMKGRR